MGDSKENGSESDAELLARIMQRVNKAEARGSLQNFYTSSEEVQEASCPSASAADGERVQERLERRMMQIAEEESGWIPGTPIPLHEEQRLRDAGLWPWTAAAKRRRLCRKTPADQWK